MHGNVLEIISPVNFMTLLEISSPEEIARWQDVPTLIYREDHNWIPHIKQDIEKIFDPGKNKLFKEGKAKRWVLQSEGNTIGRIAAFISAKYSGAQSQPTGGIGFFECIDNREAAFALFDTAFAWLKSEGMEAVDGPINFGEKEAYWGLLVMNFTDMNSFRMNYNPPYYHAFFEAYGFRTYYEQLCFRRDLHIPLQQLYKDKASRLLQDHAYTVRSARGKSLEQIAMDFLAVYNAAWAVHPGFKKMDIQVARKAVAGMKQVMDKDIMVFAYHHERPIGFYLNLPEVNEFMRHIGGDLNLLGKLKFLFYKWFGKRTTMVGIVFGVDEAYHGKGVEGVMIKYCEEHIVPLNRYQWTIMTWIGDFNPKMIRVAENLGASPYRKLVTMRKYFDEKREFQRHPII